MPKSPLQVFLFSIGMVFFIIGAIGIFLPLLPTIPFWIVAAAFFSKSSPKMEAWLLKQPHVGPMILEWRQKKMIRRQTKQIASLSIVIMVTPPMIFIPMPLAIKIIIPFFCLIVIAWIWKQKEE